MPTSQKRSLKREKVMLTDTVGGPLGTVPELLFEKKVLIPALLHLLVETNVNP